MTLEQHREFGDFLKDHREKLLQWAVLVQNLYPLASRQAKAAKRALDAIGELKNQMDNAVCAEQPGVEDAHEIYYGFSKEWHAQQEKKTEERAVQHKTGIRDRTCTG